MIIMQLENIFFVRMEIEYIYFETAKWDHRLEKGQSCTFWSQHVAFTAKFNLNLFQFRETVIFWERKA